MTLVMDDLLERSSMTKLQAARVQEILVDCLYRDEEWNGPLDVEHLPDGAVLSPGILHTFAFHPRRLVRYRTEIIELLAELPEAFQPVSKGGGGGSTFLGACADRHGNQWGQHEDMERLLCLGAALGLVEWNRHPYLVQNSGIPWVRVLLVDSDTETR
jgi:hypothetical protein